MVLDEFSSFFTDTPKCVRSVQLPKSIVKRIFNRFWKSFFKWLYFFWKAYFCHRNRLGRPNSSLGWGWAVFFTKSSLGGIFADELQIRTQLYKKLELFLQIVIKINKVITNFSVLEMPIVIFRGFQTPCTVENTLAAKVSKRSLRFFNPIEKIFRTRNTVIPQSRTVLENFRCSEKSL